MGNLLAAAALAIVASLTLVVTGCNASMTSSPELLVDEDFTAEEFAIVEQAARAWEPAVHFRVSRVSHADAYTLEGAANTVHVYRSASLLAATWDCPIPPRADTRREGITTFRPHLGSATACFLPPAALGSNGPGNSVPGVIAHELGHSVGLGHLEDWHALMHESVADGVEAPTCEDWRALSGVLGTSVPAACE